ncbi:CPBP family intramembrane metalloprotease [Pseudenhygromyxa sp. WMMC2535]|uniref:myxosortase MrtZ n=1 Tax=Pseudenhygromyxa sp. WMMC2535 TaxID=2712867 RepID=UPI001554CC7D|nr:CPBP family intramembrane metalloprotease [Pseudenhygromyxa sp. WMMC2535]
MSTTEQPDRPDQPEQLTPAQARSLARRAVLVTAALYLGYGALRQVPWPPVIAESIGVVLIAGFYLLPGTMLRDRPTLAQRWQVGPDMPIPPWRRSGWVWAAIAAALIFPIFALGTWTFYWRVCQGDLSLLSPVIAVEAHTPGAGGLEAFLARQCRHHPGGFWPRGLYVPLEWTEYYGLGFVRALAVGLFAVALPEEVFHRGYLMSALEQRFPAKRELLGVPFGWAAVISSALFALGHLVTVPNTARLATFFPALVFAWLWRRSGSLWAPALFHVASNLLMDMLLASTFPPR